MFPKYKHRQYITVTFFIYIQHIPCPTIVYVHTAYRSDNFRSGDNGDSYMHSNDILLYDLAVTIFLSLFSY